MVSKIATFVLLIGILIVGGYVGFAAFSQRQQSWNQYSGAKIEFQYPGGWEIKELTDGDVRLRSRDFPKNSSEKLLTNGTEVLFFLSGKNTLEEPLSDFIRKNEKAAEKIEELKVGNKDAIKVESKGSGIVDPGGVVETTYYFAKDGKLYLIRRTYPVGRQVEYEEVFQKILAKVQFRL